MARLLITILFTAACITLSAQADPAAVSALDRFADIAVRAPSVTYEFRLVTDDATEGRSDTISGTIVLSGDMYRLTLPDNTIYYDGEDVWNHLPDLNEVTITKPEEDELSFFARPSLLFTMHREEFKVRLLDETMTNYTIDLYPEEPHTGLIRFRVTIGKSRFDLISAQYALTNGITVSLRVLDQDISFVPPDDYFSFNPDNHPDIEVVDMRF